MARTKRKNRRPGTRNSCPTPSNIPSASPRNTPRQHLDFLPVEMVERIATFLPSQAFFAAREASPTFAWKSLHFFRKRFYETRRIMLSDKGIFTLVAISEDETLASYVRFLVVGCEYLPVCGSSHIEGKTTKLREQRLRAFKAFRNKQERGYDTGRYEALLTIALENLEECTSVQIIDWDESSPQLPKHSYGAPSMFRQTGISTEREQGWYSQDLLTDICQIVLGALLASKRPLQVFEVKLLRGDSGTVLDVFKIPEHLASSMPIVFGGLRDLALDVSWHAWMETPRQLLYHLTRFINCAPQLKKLGLTLGSRERVGQTILNHLARYLTLKKLTNLELNFRGHKVTEGELMGFLLACGRNCPLRVLDLTGGNLVAGTWRSILLQIRDGLSLESCVVWRLRSNCEDVRFFNSVEPKYVEDYATRMMAKDSFYTEMSLMAKNHLIAPEDYFESLPKTPKRSELENTNTRRFSRKFGSMVN